jgi:molecular chaperone GrpE
VLQDEVLRAYAEVQNEMEGVRRIAKTDSENAKKFALQSIGKSLLEVYDNLKRGRQSIKGIDGDADAPAESAPVIPDAHTVLHSLYRGVVLTEKAFLKTLEEHRIKRVCHCPLRPPLPSSLPLSTVCCSFCCSLPPLLLALQFEAMGVKADPNLHNVLFDIEDPSKAPGTIIEARTALHRTAPHSPLSALHRSALLCCALLCSPLLLCCPLRLFRC